MTNEEKAKEIYKDSKFELEVKGGVQDEQEILFMLEKMAAWKDKVKPTLTTEDIMRILNIESEFQDETPILEIKKMNYKEYCEEILKRYLEKLPKEEEK